MNGLQCSSSSSFPLRYSWFAIFVGEIFAYLTFLFNHRDSHFPTLGMMHAGCVSVAGVYPSRTCMSASFESMQWNISVHRLDLGLYSHPKEYC